VCVQVSGLPFALNARTGESEHETHKALERSARAEAGRAVLRVLAEAQRPLFGRLWDAYTAADATRALQRARPSSQAAAEPLYSCTGLERTLHLADVHTHAELVWLIDVLRFLARQRGEHAGIDASANIEAAGKLAKAELGIALQPLLDDLIAAIGTSRRLQRAGTSKRQQAEAAALLASIKVHARSAALGSSTTPGSSDDDGDAASMGWRSTEAVDRLIGQLMRHMRVVEVLLVKDGLLSVEVTALDTHADSFARERRNERWRAKLETVTATIKSAVVIATWWGGVSGTLYLLVLASRR